MKAYELRLAGLFLEELGDRYGNDGCNDMDLGAYGLTAEQVDELAETLRGRRNDPRELEGRPLTRAFANFELTGYLAERLNVASKEGLVSLNDVKALGDALKRDIKEITERALKETK